MIENHLGEALFDLATLLNSPNHACDLKKTRSTPCRKCNDMWHLRCPCGGEMCLKPGLIESHETYFTYRCKTCTTILEFEESRWVWIGDGIEILVNKSTGEREQVRHQYVFAYMGRERIWGKPIDVQDYQV